MARQKEMNGAGNGQNVASFTRGAGELAHDVIELGELQVNLLRADVSEALERSTLPAIVVAIGLVAAASCAPAIVLSVGFALAEFTPLSVAGGLAIASVSVFVLSMAAAGLAAWRMKSSFAVFHRSMDEFSRNVRWIKAVLRHGGAASPTRLSR
ncbi:phage holin family protein [Lignipirellula cremea]|uniref:Uncharacterized protein n=1 Tax=Lignipirellula cremea TaxID=2528010 RepID=A0A518DU78_9BACT|nr:phage holin family protein [Lignipirellula cremea]QDU95389.1 hypothetical protein Pla8534_32040 [Lignipirellula cremea]